MAKAEPNRKNVLTALHRASREATMVKFDPTWLPWVEEFQNNNGGSIVRRSDGTMVFVFKEENYDG